MIKTQYVRYASIQSRSVLARVLLILIFFAVSAFSYLLPNRPPRLHPIQANMFQSVLPEPKEQTPAKPESWIFADKGGVREADVLTILLPQGFTNQRGANVFANMIIGSSSLRKPSNVLPATEFTVGIWPANDQVQFQKSIEIRIAINPAQLPPDGGQKLTLMMYNPQTDLWEAQPSLFVESSLEVVAHVQLFRPVAKNFPDWGGRTFFSVANLGLNKPVTNITPTARLNANLRSGPGRNYSIVGKAAQGQPLQLVEKSTDGRWYKLTNQKWIAASLVLNPPELPVFTPTSTPKSP